MRLQERGRCRATVGNTLKVVGVNSSIPFLNFSYQAISTQGHFTMLRRTVLSFSFPTVLAAPALSQTPAERQEQPWFHQCLAAKVQSGEYFKSAFAAAEHCHNLPEAEQIKFSVQRERTIDDAAETAELNGVQQTVPHPAKIVVNVGKGQCLGHVTIDDGQSKSPAIFSIAGMNINKDTGV
jgi:hypothetical protein